MPVSGKVMSDLLVAAGVKSQSDNVAQPRENFSALTSSTYAIVRLAHRLASADEFVKRRHISDTGEAFRGCVIWREDWGFWSAPSENVGGYIYSALTNVGSNSTSAVQFDSSEFTQASAAILALLVFQWDGWIFFRDPAVAIRLSHNSTISAVCSEDPSAADAVRQLIASDT